VPGAGFCQFDAGILDAQDKLTPEAKKAFIKSVQDEMRLGTSGAPKSFIKCGPDLAPVPNADMIDLTDDKAFPQFHANALGLYEKMAAALNLKGQFSILPICDPIALAVQLQLDVPKLKFPGDFITYGIALPALAVKLGFTIPVDLAAKFPALLAKVQLPPAFKFPKFDFDLPAEVDLAKFAFPYPKIPSMVLGLVGQMPAIFIKLLAFDFSAICGAVLKSQLFGSFDPATSPVWVTTNKVLVRKTVELVIIAIVATTVGSSSAGIVGNMGLLFGLKPPPGPKSKESTPAAQATKGATAAAGSSWSNDTAALNTTGSDFSKAKLTYTQFLMAQELSPAPKPGASLKPYSAAETAQLTEKAYRSIRKVNSSILFARACLWRGGAQGPFFTKPWQETGALKKLLAEVDKKGATVPYSKTNVPRMPAGTVLLMSPLDTTGLEVSFILTEEYPGGPLKRVMGVEAGAPDAANENLQTSIEAVSYVIITTTKGYVSAGRTVSTAVPIFRIIDASKMAS
jgi:hypothetical protein